MNNTNQNHAPVTDEEIAIACRGGEDWLTVEAVRDCLNVFQPFYKQRLTAEDGVEIMMNTWQLFDILYPNGVGADADASAAATRSVAAAPSGSIPASPDVGSAGLATVADG